MQSLIISTGMCSDAEGEESQYPQVGGVSSSPSFLEVYWRCIVLFFASSIRHNPSARHQLFVNRPQIPNIGAFQTGKFLSDLGVEVIVVPFTYAPPPNYYKQWRSTFYLLDIIKHIASNCQPEEQYLITDSDCLFVKSADNLAQAIKQYGLLTYDTKFPVTEDANGLTRLGLQALYEKMSGRPVPDTPLYCGGDIFAATSEVIRRFAAEIGPAWDASMALHAAGQTHFNTEEHFLSYLVYKLSYPVGEANPFLSRIWTGRKYRTASVADFDLTIWHVPAEKKHGFKRLFQQVVRPDSQFWTVAAGKDFARYAAGYLGIPSSSLWKKSCDLFDTVAWRIVSEVTKKRRAVAKPSQVSEEASL